MKIPWIEKKPGYWRTWWPPNQVILHVYGIKDLGICVLEVSAGGMRYMIRMEEPTIRDASLAGLIFLQALGWKPPPKDFLK
jgi:hypothetical protein